MRDELRCLFGTNGLLPGEELRALDQAGLLGTGLSPAKARANLMRKRYPPEPLSPAKARAELMRRRYPKEGA